MLDKELEITISRAFNDASQQCHEFVTVEHLLLALIDNPSAQEVLKVCGADLVVLKNELNTVIKKKPDFARRRR